MENVPKNSSVIVRGWTLYASRIPQDSVSTNKRGAKLAALLKFLSNGRNSIVLMCKFHCAALSTGKDA